MKKKLDTSGVMNELRGQSVFFPKEPQEQTAQEQSPIPSLSSEQHKQAEVTSDTAIPRYHDTVQPSNHDTTVSEVETDLLEAVRKAVRQLGKEPATQRRTLEEKQALADIEYSYKRQGIRTSGNEIIRIATNYIVRDYRKNGENSILAKVLHRLNF